MDKELEKDFIAKRAAKELKDGDVVNLGIGLPTLVANHLPEGVHITLQSENGFIGMGPAPLAGTEDADLVNAGGILSTINPGGAFFDSAYSFAMIRGGHVDASILGGLEVDEKGNLANWIVPGKLVPGMGGAMDLVTGAKKVIIAMNHTAKGNEPKILSKCTLPVTAVNCVDLIITEMGVMEVTDKGLVLNEINPEYSVEDVQKVTGAKLIIPKDIKPMSS
jgi:acetate CoA/acetoacetate CoA-transferase beta subunit